MLNYRQERIIELLNNKKYMKVEEVAKALYISEATARREFAKLSQLGLITRDRGGAFLSENSDEINIFVRREFNSNKKIKCAQIALNHLPDFQSVFIDNSSTALALAELMNLKFKTLITNGLAIAEKISKLPDTTVVLVGGRVYQGFNSIVGPRAVMLIEEMQFDLYIGSCASVNIKGSYETSIEQATIKRIAMENSKYKVLLFDDTKLNKSGMNRAARLLDYDLICTNAPDDNDDIVQFREIHPNVINK